jgi:hypothetical protein
VQYPHVIDTSMTIHMQKEQNILSKNKNKRKDKMSLLRKNIVPLMFKGDDIDAQ